MYPIGYKDIVFYRIQLPMNKAKKLTALGLKVKEFRLSKNMTQMELAHKLGKDHPSINKLENGKVNPSYIFLLEVCEGLEIDIKELF